MSRLGETVTQNDARTTGVTGFSDNKIDAVGADGALLNTVAHQRSFTQSDWETQVACEAHDVKNDMARSEVITAKKFDALERESSINIVIQTHK